MSDITVAVCVRDGELYLDEALRSAIAERPAELIVIDDGSRDRTAEIAKRAGARVVSSPPLGLPSARRLAVSEASCELIAFLDADDRFVPGRNAALTAALAANPGATTAVGRMRQFFTPEREAELSQKFKLRNDARPCWIATGSLILRSALVEHQLELGTRFEPMHDWLARARERNETCEIEDIVVDRRIHGDNLSLTQNSRDLYLSVAKAAIARRRQENS